MWCVILTSSGQTYLREEECNMLLLYYSEWNKEFVKRNISMSKHETNSPRIKWPLKYQLEFLLFVNNLIYKRFLTYHRGFVITFVIFSYAIPFPLAWFFCISLWTYFHTLWLFFCILFIINLQFCSHTFSYILKKVWNAALIIECI